MNGVLKIVICGNFVSLSISIFLGVACTVSVDWVKRELTSCIIGVKKIQVLFINRQSVATRSSLPKTGLNGFIVSSCPRGDKHLTSNCNKNSLTDCVIMALMNSETKFRRL